MDLAYPAELHGSAGIGRIYGTKRECYVPRAQLSVGAISQFVDFISALRLRIASENRENNFVEPAQFSVISMFFYLGSSEWHEAIGVVLSAAGVRRREHDESIDQ